jgi:hypothetical protein
MKDYVNEYLAEKKRSAEYPVAPAMHFKRGGRMSVQASSAHYCSPKSNTGPYTTVEVLVLGRTKAPKTFGKPSEKFEDGDRLFAWVPVEVVNEEIARRGGLA